MFGIRKPTKKFKLQPKDFRELVPAMGGCIATDQITVDGNRVHFMYRDYPQKGFPDSGWHFFSGHESDEYVKDPKNMEVYNVNTIANCDPDIIPFLQAPYQSAFERNHQGKFMQVFDYEFGGTKLTLEKVLKAPSNDLQVFPTLSKSHPAFGISELDEFLSKYDGIKAWHNWIRVLGGKSNHFNRSIVEWNEVAGMDTSKQILIADDVAGGFWAIDREFCRIKYLAPEKLEWEETYLTFFGFLEWIANMPKEVFNKKYLWTGWEEEVAKIPDDKAFTFYPFPFTKEFDINTCRKAVVPISDVWEYVKTVKAKLK